MNNLKKLREKILYKDTPNIVLTGVWYDHNPKKEGAEDKMPERARGRLVRIRWNGRDYEAAAPSSSWAWDDRNLTAYMIMEDDRE